MIIDTTCSVVERKMKEVIEAPKPVMFSIFTISKGALVSGGHLLDNFTTFTANVSNIMQSRAFDCYCSDGTFVEGKITWIKSTTPELKDAIELHDNMCHPDQ